MTTGNWQDHFKSYIKDAENLYSKDSTSISLLMFCLRSKMLPLQTYLDWAMENYQLPVLSEKFFQIHPPQQEFFKKWQHLHTWSPECLPIAEWDGALIVACLEKPENYNHPTNTVFVLTSHEVLDQAWGIYNKSASSSDTDFADMTSLAATVVATPAELNLFDENGDIVLQDGDSEEETPEPLEEKSAEETEEISLEEVSGSPEGLFGELPAQKGPRSVEPLLTATTPSFEEKTTIDERPETVTSRLVEDSAPAAETPKQNLRPQHSISAYTLEKLRNQGADLFDKEAMAAFQQLKTFFKKSMLLAVGDKDRLIKPLLWDDGFDLEIPQNSEFDLTTPSIFKIVSGTQKPYHGMIVINDLNESFFESCNQGQIPDHVTLVPIINGELVVGMLMGIGEKASYNKNVLRFTENVAKTLSQRILPSATSAKAA